MVYYVISYYTIMLYCAVSYYAGLRRFDYYTTYYYYTSYNTNNHNTSSSNTNTTTTNNNNNNNYHHHHHHYCNKTSSNTDSTQASPEPWLCVLLWVLNNNTFQTQANSEELEALAKAKAIHM